jgi:predicted DNA-binding transcriptional regulator YafY
MCIDVISGTFCKIKQNQKLLKKNSMKKEYDKALYRLLEILKRLYEGERLHTKNLAFDFNVTERTIRRDFTRLSYFPIEKTTEGYKYADGFHLLKSSKDDEILLFEMFEQFSKSMGEGASRIISTQLSKLRNPSAKHPFFFNAVIEDITDKSELFLLMQDAIEQKRVVHLKYLEKTREVHPYKIASFEGFWYLFCKEKERYKTFYFKDIQNVFIKEEIFICDMQALRIMENALNIWFEAQEEVFEVLLHVDKIIAKHLDRRPLSKTQKVIKQYENGDVKISVHATSDNEVIHMLKKWLPHIKVIAPLHIHEKFIKELQTYIDA